jgi:hypothetical protein
MTKLLLFYLTDSNRQYTFTHFLNFICSSKLSYEWTLLVLTHDDDSDFYYKEAITKSINFTIIRTQSDNNYMRKILTAVTFAEENNIPYMMKCDNDIFFKSDTLDFIINNLGLLESDKHLTITPVISSGIPGVEYFMDQFLDKETKNELEKIFLKTVFDDKCGASYDYLNKHTLLSEKWNKTEFFNSVKQQNHHYKGVHPIRFSHEAMIFLNNYIIMNKEKFLNSNDMSIIYDDNSPYLCNSIFAIKTDTYKKIVYDNSLYVDPYEEVPLNKYCWNNNMNHLFIKNGFAIHMYYNWFPNHNNSEIEFCNKFFYEK